MKQVLCVWLFLCAAQAGAVSCKDVDYDGNFYSVCTVDVEAENLRLFHSDEADEVYGNFSTLEANLGVQTLAFAMNAGMYHDDRSPVGYYLENGVEKMFVVPNAGPGNFGLLPNGVFCITENSANVIETIAFLEAEPDCQYATQSGPMLVINGNLHPKFLVDGTSRNIRNGVGTSADGKTAYFAISNNTVNFYDFGSFFRDYLKTPQALYFDGRVSRLHSTDLKRSDIGSRMGPIVGVVE